MNKYLSWFTLFCTLALAILHSVRALTIIQQKNYRLEKDSAQIKREKALFFVYCASTGIALAILAYLKLWLPTATLMLIITLFLQDGLQS